MPSTKDDGTAAAAAQQLGSMSLGESAGRIVEPENTPTKRLLCSACGEKSNTLKKCNGCKCVYYCDKECQNRHWKEHRKECKRIKKALENRGGKLDLGTETDLGPLEKLPQREECPICMCILPIRENLQSYLACCGKTICCGCEFQHHLKSKGQGVMPTCAFCRTAPPESDEEYLAQLRNRVECKDPDAMFNMAAYYGDGLHGLSVDEAKCIGLLREAAGLGYSGAQYNLGHYYANGEMGLEQNEEEALKYYKKAAEKSDIGALHYLGCAEEENGDFAAAMRHWRMAASYGYWESMSVLTECFEEGLIHHGDLAESIRGFYCARAEMKSEYRDQFIEHLKRTGEYRAEYDL